MADQQERSRRRRSTSPTPRSDRSEIRWEMRRRRKPWQRFLERFGFTLIALGIAMAVGVMIAKMG